MRTQEELTAACGEMLRRMRSETGVSKARMADAIGVDAKTYNRFEAGISAPTVPQFVALFDSLDRAALRTVLDYLYPDVYEGLTPSSDPSALRSAAVHYYRSDATDRTIRLWDFITFGSHGSNILPQLEEICALDHLPLACRIAVASMIQTMFLLESAHGNIIAEDHIMPDMDLLSSAIEQAKKAVLNDSNSYTTSQR